MSGKVFQVIGKKWALPIIKKLEEFDELRFNEIKNHLNITPRNLSITLKELEKQNIVSKKYYDDDIPNFSYILTNYGKIVSYTSNLISIVGKKIPENSTKNALQISNTLIHEIKQLKNMDTIQDKEIKTLSETVEGLIKSGINNMKNNAVKYFVPVGGLCGLGVSCIDHGLHHVFHIDLVL